MCVCVWCVGDRQVATESSVSASDVYLDNLQVIIRLVYVSLENDAALNLNAKRKGGGRR